MPLPLTRPVVFVDLETTGVDISKDRIVQIAAIKLHPDGTRDMKETRRVNPGMPIPASASAVHGIYDVDVEGAPSFKDVAEAWSAFIAGCDIGGFNAKKFDWPLLVKEGLRASVAFDTNVTVIDSMLIFHKYHPRNLAAAYRTYVGVELEGAHDAKTDIGATLEVFIHQLLQHKDLAECKDAAELMSVVSPRDPSWVDAEGKLKRSETGGTRLNFGKYAGCLLESVDEGFLRWMLKSDFAEDVKAEVRKALDARPKTPSARG